MTAGRHPAERAGDLRPGWWRPALAAAVLFALVAALVTLDRRRPETSAPATATTIAAGETDGAAPEGVTESALRVPGGLTGTLYVLAEDDTLTEVDLATGRTRIAPLPFAVSAGSWAQVVALDEALLVATRRAVYRIDRATLTDIAPLAEDRRVVAGADGSWAALVPFGASAGQIELIDGDGTVTGTPPLGVDAGVVVQGAVDNALVVDAGGTVQLLRRDGSPGAALGNGRHLASAAATVARLVCVELDCSVHSGTAAQPDQHVLRDVALTGTWEAGPGAAIDRQGTRMVAITAAAGRGDPRSDRSPAEVRLFDLAADARRSSASPLAPGPNRSAQTLAFTADNSTVVHSSPQGVALWRPAPFGGTQAATIAELPTAAAAVALTVSPQPPPPPPVGGPPPSFA